MDLCDRMHSIVSLLLLLLVGCSQRAQGFLVPHPRVAISLTELCSSKKENEIAALEAKLRQLKEESSKEEEFTSAPMDNRNGRVMDPMTEMLTEQWKEGDPEQSDQGGVGSTMVAVVAAIGLAVVLGFLAQVPVGQEELSKYSSIKSGAVTQSIDLGDLNAARKALY